MLPFQNLALIKLNLQNIVFSKLLSRSTIIVAQLSVNHTTKKIHHHHRHQDIPLQKITIASFHILTPINALFKKYKSNSIKLKTLKNFENLKAFRLRVIARG